MIIGNIFQIGTLRGLLLLSALTLVAGCAEHELGIETGSLGDRADHRRAGLVLDDAAAAREHFRAGRYGLAEEHFRKAVAENPGNGSAWVGLAASYDQLRRFDLAEKAYRRAQQIEGETVALLNNLGYHYMLRGRHELARRKFEAAARLAPHDERIKANLVVLAGGPPPPPQ